MLSRDRDASRDESAGTANAIEIDESLASQYHGFVLHQNEYSPTAEDDWESEGY